MISAAELLSWLSKALSNFYFAQDIAAERANAVTSSEYTRETSLDDKVEVKWALGRTLRR